MSPLFDPSLITNHFAELGSAFYTRLDPQGLTAPRLLHANNALAQSIGLTSDAIQSVSFVQTMAGNQPLPNGKTLAAVYSGHQFGHWAGQLGDGRAHLLGAVQTDSGPLEIQLKGAGLTPYSRMGDGRAVLRSSIREYLASQAMTGLGIPTTQALAIVVSDDPVYRETVETAAVVARTAPSFIRFGSFEHWANHPKQLVQLLHYVVDHFYPKVGTPGLSSDTQLVQGVLREVVRRSAQLVAHWQTVGFCHGVMNTDNMSILGLTIDYGPYAFIDGFKIDYICNRTDQGGRYAWFRQPSIVHWNLARLASCFLDICTEAELQEVLGHYENDYLLQYHSNLQQKFGFDQWRSGDEVLANDWWQLLHDHQADLTLSFRSLSTVFEHPDAWLALFEHSAAAQAWLQRYVQRSQQNQQTLSARLQQMNQHNPLYVLRNHLAQIAIEAAQKGDVEPLDRLFKVLAQPYEWQEGYDDLALPPTADQLLPALSCSS